MFTQARDDGFLIEETGQVLVMRDRVEVRVGKER